MCNRPVDSSGNEKVILNLFFLPNMQAETLIGGLTFSIGDLVWRVKIGIKNTVRSNTLTY